MNIVVVEDEEALREEIVFHLQLAGHEVTSVGSAAALYRHLAIAKVELIVLDLGLPDEDGMSVAAHVRVRGCGLVMLTARSSMEERIACLQSGADAYLTKPVDFSLLNATIGSVSRRLVPANTPSVIKTEWRLAAENWSLLSPDGATVLMTARETTLLKLLFAIPGEVVERQVLNRALNDGVDDSDYRPLEAMISRLRRKIQQQSQLSMPLKTVHGVGYAFLC